MALGLPVLNLISPGQRFMHRERSADQNPIQEIFKLETKIYQLFQRKSKI